MARKKVTKTGVSEVHSAATRETALELANMFNDFAIEKFGALNPPSAYVTPSGKKLLYKTSMSRTDTGSEGDRGNGSCETIYVTSVKIGNTIYK